jgi:hypothetical protein
MMRTARRLLEKMTLSLKIIFDSFSAHLEGLCFQCDRDGEFIRCAIVEVAVRDLIDFHRSNFTEDDALRALLPEIERLVSAKCDAGRFEEGGWLVIWPADLLRYGYQGRRAA